jgi:hypothetical protein
LEARRRITRTSNLGKLAGFVTEGVTFVPNTATRDLQFPTPDTNQRVENAEMGNIERWDGANWGVDFQGVRRGPIWDVRAFGAKGDGITDDALAIQQALTAAGGAAVSAIKGAATSVAGASGGVSDGSTPNGTTSGAVLLPRGKYVISSTLYVPAGWRFEIAPALEPEEWQHRRSGAVSIDYVDGETHVVVMDPDARREHGQQLRNYALLSTRDMTRGASKTVPWHDARGAQVTAFDMPNHTKLHALARILLARIIDLVLFVERYPT